MKVLANDGISKSGIKALEKGGFEVITTKVAQEQVANYINTHDVKVILVRSATKVLKDIIDDCPGLKIIGRGGVIDEVALVEALDNNKVLFAGLDVFENEPTPEIKILMHPKISLTPHIGAATGEAQDRIGTELAEQIISLLKNN